MPGVPGVASTSSVSTASSGGRRRARSVIRVELGLGVREPRRFSSELPFEYDQRYNNSMTTRKERLTVTVDPDLVEAGNQAVADGLADSLSAWVNAALVDRALRDRRLQSLSEAISAYEATHGEITPDEMTAQARNDRESAEVVRGPSRASKPLSKRTRRGAA